jgi:lipopolysaccharide/colanic/teichoic acid biosynthesis glycosyltransferase
MFDLKTKDCAIDSPVPSRGRGRRPSDQLRFGEAMIACALLVCIFPLLVVIAVAIGSESAGPVFERQERIGFGGRRFTILRFRTTRHSSENVVPMWKQVTELTRLGLFLRWTRIDELPQLINVLRGDLRLADFLEQIF